MASPTTPDIDVLGSAEEALAAADRLVAAFAPDAADRDRTRAVPRGELDAVSASGLLGAPVPTDLGGAGIAPSVQAEILRRLAVADPSIAQTLLPHLVVLGAVVGLAPESLRERVLGDVLAGARIGNAISERGTKHAWDPRTRLARQPDGGLLITGRKYYATGALTATWIGVSAKDDEDRLVLVLVPRDAPGLEVSDEWTSFGQRSTISGPAVLEGVAVEDEQVLPLWQAFVGPTTGGAFDQLLHAALDVGIAHAALRDAAWFVREHSRPWFESDAERAGDEPEVIGRIGQIGARVIAVEAAFRDTGRLLDATGATELTDDSTAEASIAVAALKAVAGEVAVDTSSVLFELAGTSATDDRHRLDRHWRNARTHTLHDPVRWKHRHIGNHVLHGIRPPRHPLI